MTLSDILTILGLIAAIIAFVSEKSREYLFLKFSFFDISIFSFGFLLVNYLVGFEWFYIHDVYFKVLLIDGWPVASVWAYLITIFLLGYLFYRIYYGFFPKQNIDKVILYYKEQLIKSEFSFLVSLIEKIHKKHIVKFLTEVSNIKIEGENPYVKGGNFDIAYKNVLNSKEKRYASAIYYEIITNEVLIDNVASTHPYFFTDFISHLSIARLADRDFVYKYLSILIKSNNYHLIRELRNHRNYNGLDRSSTENQILLALFKNIKVADLNSAWQPYGKLTCAYLEEEKQNRSSILRENFFGDESEFWQVRIFQAICFFDIMLTEAILQNLQSHMWLSYFRNFTNGLIENIPEDAGDLIGGSSIPTNNHYFIHQMISVMTNWIELMHEKNRNNIMESTCDCIGQCLYSISSGVHLSDEFAIYCFDTVLRKYFYLSEHIRTDIERQLLERPIAVKINPNKEGFTFLQKEYNAEKKRKIMEKFLISPVMTFDIPKYATQKEDYIRILNLAWEEFDKVPYQAHEDNGSIQRFERRVLNILNN